MGSARQRCRVLPAGVGSDGNPHLRCSIAQGGSQFAQKDTMPVAVRRTSTLRRLGPRWPLVTRLLV
jgi:hypothetical protein